MQGLASHHIYLLIKLCPSRRPYLYIVGAGSKIHSLQFTDRAGIKRPRCRSPHWASDSTQRGETPVTPSRAVGGLFGCGTLRSVLTQLHLLGCLDMGTMRKSVKIPLTFPPEVDACVGS